MGTDEWTSCVLRDLVDIKHGFAFEGRFFRDDPPGDVLLTPGNFGVGGGFKGDKLKYYVGSVPAGFVLEEGDLLVTMTDLSRNADTLGYPALVPPSVHGRFLHNQRLGKILIRNPQALCRRFLYYLMCSQLYRHEIVATATGTTVKHTSPARILAFRFRCPPLPQQRAIAHVLGTLDDKIDLNRRMNETLEAIGRAIFKSWFVDFDPVRAKAEGRDPPCMDAETAALFPDGFQDSQLGRTPKGWGIVTLPEVVEINPPRSLRKGQAAPYLDMAHMPTRTHSPDMVVERPFGSGMRFINGDTLLARITPCLENGKTAFVDFLEDGQIGWGSTEYIVLRPKLPLPTEYGYCLARSEAFRGFAIQTMAGTSGRQRVPAESLAHFLTVSPPARVAEMFGWLSRPLLARAHAATEESRTLAALRDALLPKLISGAIRLPETDRSRTPATSVELSRATPTHSST